MDKNETLETAQFERLIQGLIQDEYGCENDFLLPETLQGLRKNMATLNDLGKMKTAGIGNKTAFHNNQLIRSDKVTWIEEDSIDAYENVYLQKIWRFINYLNQSCFTSIKTYESHYANYEVGSFYKRHLDQFKNEKGRKFSIVLYLNQDWKDEDEGTLALYPLNRMQKDIAPVDGRIVFFRSDEMEHEVRPSTTKERKSITGWMKI